MLWGSRNEHEHLSSENHYTKLAEGCQVLRRYRKSLCPLQSECAVRVYSILALILRIDLKAHEHYIIPVSLYLLTSTLCSRHTKKLAWTFLFCLAFESPSIWNTLHYNFYLLKSYPSAVALYHCRLQEEWKFEERLRNGQVWILLKEKHDCWV